mmetsp:Transcript_7652/g.24350  ORF Transcript_7652/g.24350 Transcript_7652/m.24350 type:complete len:299 (+) Transcript_7652:107-1003(+)
MTLGIWPGLHRTRAAATLAGTRARCQIVGCSHVEALGPHVVRVHVLEGSGFRLPPAGPITKGAAPALRACAFLPLGAEVRRRQRRGRIAPHPGPHALPHLFRRLRGREPARHHCGISLVPHDGLLPLPRVPSHPRLALHAVRVLVCRTPAACPREEQVVLRREEPPHELRIRDRAASVNVDCVEQAGDSLMGHSKVQEVEHVKETLKSEQAITIVVEQVEQHGDVVSLVSPLLQGFSCPFDEEDTVALLPDLEEDLADDSERYRHVQATADNQHGDDDGSKIALRRHVSIPDRHHRDN